MELVETADDAAPLVDGVKTDYTVTDAPEGAGEGKKKTRAHPFGMSDPPRRAQCRSPGTSRMGHHPYLLTRGVLCVRPVCMCLPTMGVTVEV